MAIDSFFIVIPARYASSRLPGKLLLDLGGKPILQHVYERALLSEATQIVIATDDERIAKVANGFGAEVCMTASEHKCGTDRIAEVMTKLHWSEKEVVVNVQGDEPFIHHEVINQVAKNLILYEEAAIATLCEPLKDNKDLFNYNVVKVVHDKNGYALYFSRAPIPWDREHFAKKTATDVPSISYNAYYRHLGIYAYRCGFVKKYVKLPSCPLEMIESLEQLRALWYGYKIHVAKTCVTGMLGIDTKDDLLKARQKLID